MGQQRTLHPSKKKQSQLTAASSQSASSALSLSEHADKESSLRSASQHQLVGYGIIQPKLTISQPADAAEREADQVADQVTRPTPEAVAPTAVSGRVMLQAESHADSAPEAPAQWQERTEALRGSGQPLPPSVREFFEPRFGYDFGQVRIHTGPEANARAREVNAQAFTMGKDIVFGAGKFAPQEPAGQHLLAHELTHVVQQAGNSRQVQRKESPDATSTALEIETLDEMKRELIRQTGNRLVKASSTFSDAAQDVKKELETKQVEPTLLGWLIETAVGALAPGYINMLLGGFKNEVKSLASGVLGLSNKPDLAVKAFLIADSLADKFIREVDEDQVMAGFLSLREGLEKKLPLVAGGPTPSLTGALLPGGPVPTGGNGNAISAGELIDQFTQTFSEYTEELDNSLKGLSKDRFDTLLGIWSAFSVSWARLDLYRAQIRDLVNQHEKLAEVAADTKSRGYGYDTEKIVLLEARGVTRPAIIQYESSRGLSQYPHWKFKKWVSAEMIGTAEVLARGQQEGLEVVKAGAPYGWVPIQGYIPDPETEGERIVEVHMWGEPRLCLVKIEGDEGTFIDWLPRDLFTRVKGARQKGGIQRFDDKKFKKGYIPRPSK